MNKMRLIVHLSVALLIVVCKLTLHFSSFSLQMDADYDENQAAEQSTFSRRKRKGRSRFAHVVSQEKPVFDPGMLLWSFVLKSSSG